MRFFAYLLLLIFLYSCNRTADRTYIVEDENLTQEQIDSVLTEYSFKYERLEFIDSTHYAMIPISTERPRRGGKMRSGSYSTEDFTRHWNILFYDIENNKTHLLTKNKLMISMYHNNMRDVGPILSRSILYQIRDSDHDNDKRLTYMDPEQLFISGNDGKMFRRLSPKGEDLKDHFIVPNSDIILFKTLRDTDKDSSFTMNDEMIWYRLDLAKDEPPIEFLNDTERQEVETLYFEQWLVEQNEE